MGIISGLTALFSGFGAWFGELSLLAQFGLRVVAGVAFNALASALAGKPTVKRPGIKGQIQQGAGLPRSFVLGRYATAGSLVYHNQWGAGNNYYTRITALSDLPISGLVEMWVDGTRYDIDTANPDPDGKGYPVITKSKTTTTMVQGPNAGDGEGPDWQVQDTTTSTTVAWVKFHDGTQTAADQFVIDNVSTAERPWTTNEIGYGVAYAIFTAKLDREIFQGLPQIIYVVDGVPLDDPDTGSTGTGDDIPVVQAHALLSGLSYGGEWFYGPQTPGLLDDAEWAAEVVKCKADVPGAAAMTDAEKIEAFGSTTVPARYRSGVEVTVDTPVAEVLEDIASACNGRIGNVGSRYRMQVGDPGNSVVSITDDDILSTAGQRFAPFFPLAETVNAVAATYPEPDEGWQTQEAPPLYNSAYEADDGNRRLPTTVDLAAVPYREQVQRLMASALAEARRARRNSISLPARFWKLEPGDYLNQTSTRNGYSAKLMRIDGISDLPNGDLAVELTEVDPTDYDWDAATDFTAGTSLPFAPMPQPAIAPVNFAASAAAIRDDDLNARRPAIVLEWSPDNLEDVAATQWQVRTATSQVLVASGSTATPEDGGAIVELSGAVVDYEVRLWHVSRSGAPSTWTAWVPVTTGDIRFGVADLDDTVQATVAPATPAVPTGLTLSSTLLSDGRAKLTASWNSVAGATGYEVRLKEGAGNWIGFPTSETEYSWDTLPGIAFTAEVRAINKTVQSAYSASDSHTTAADSTPPATPTGLTVTAGFGVLWLKWSDNTEADFHHYEIYEGTTSTAPTSGTAATFSATGNQMAREGLGDGVQRWYWIRAVDTSGNASAWSAAVNATTVAELTADRLAAQVMNYDSAVITMDADQIHEVTIGASGTAVYDTDAFSGSHSMRIGYANTEDPVSGNLTDGVKIEIPASTSLRFVGRRIKVSAKIKKPASNASAECAFSYAQAGTGNSGYHRFSPATVWQNVSFTYDVEMPDVSTPDYVILWGDTSNSGLEVLVDHITIEMVDNLADQPGTIVETQIADASISTPKLKASAVTANILAASAVVADKIAASAVETSKLAAGAVETDKLAANAVTAAKVTTGELLTLSAQIKDAIITDAKVVEMSAAKLMAGTALASTITVNGTALSDVESRAADPAARINAASTQIDPGKIVIDGGTSLADWRGTDKTTIDGGALENKSISTTKLLVSDTTNLNPDLNYSDPTLWTLKGGGTLTFRGVAWPANWGSTQVMVLEDTNFTWGDGPEFDINPDGEQFWMRATGKNLDPEGDGGWVVHLYAYDPVADDWVNMWGDGGSTPGSSNATPTTEEGSFTIPSGYTKGRIRFYLGSGSTKVEFGGITLRRKSGTVMIEDGAITAEKMTVTDLSAITANLGTIEVDSAHIANLAVDRIHVADGAVSDGSSLLATSETLFNDSDTVMTLSTGPVSADQFWHLSMFVEIRNAGTFTGEGGNGDPVYGQKITYARIDQRNKINGAWGAWFHIHQTAYYNSSAWGERAFATSLAGNYDDMEFRITSVVTYYASGSFSAPQSTSSQTNFRIRGLVAKAVVK